MTDEELQRLRELAENATPGHWFVGVEKGGYGVYLVGASIAEYFYRQADAWFCAAARTAVPALLDEVARLQAEVQRLREALAFYANQASWHTTYEDMENGGGRYVTSPIIEDEGQRAYEALEEK